MNSSKYLVPEKALRTYDMSEDVLSHMSIHCTEWIIQDVDISVLVYRSGQTDSLFLSSTQVDTLQQTHAWGDLYY